MSSFEAALREVEDFAPGETLRDRIAGLEAVISGKLAGDLPEMLEREAVNDALLSAALRIKNAAGQINVIIHAVGMLVSLPYVLEPDEEVLALSLGAGNTGREFDLETDRRVGEFKFIRWRGGPEAIRQNGLFVDLFNLVEHESKRRRCLYVVGLEAPMRFLKGNRAIRSVLSKNPAVLEEFTDRYGDEYSVVSQYFKDVADSVEVVDLVDHVPAFGRA